MVAFKVKRDRLSPEERDFEAREKVLFILEKAFMQRMNKFINAIRENNGSFEIIVDAKDYKIELKGENIPSHLMDKIERDMNYLM